jgi:hypothetical protein
MELPWLDMCTTGTALVHPRQPCAQNASNIAGHHGQLVGDDPQYCSNRSGDGLHFPCLALYLPDTAAAHLRLVSFLCAVCAIWAKTLEAFWSEAPGSFVFAASLFQAQFCHCKQSFAATTKECYFNQSLQRAEKAFAWCCFHVTANASLLLGVNKLW